MRVEPYPILSATASTTESSGRKLSRFTLSHIEALGCVMPPWHSDEELISIRQLLTPHMCGGCGWDFPHILSQFRITESDKPGEMVQA